MASAARRQIIAAAAEPKNCRWRRRGRRRALNGTMLSRWWALRLGMSSSSSSRSHLKAVLAVLLELGAHLSSFFSKSSTPFLSCFRKQLCKSFLSELPQLFVRHGVHKSIRDQGRDLGGTGGTAPKKLRWGDGPCIGPPNI